jgi:hypothetical protein
MLLEQFDLQMRVFSGEGGEILAEFSIGRGRKETHRAGVIREDGVPDRAGPLLHARRRPGCRRRKEGSWVGRRWKGRCVGDRAALQASPWRRDSVIPPNRVGPCRFHRQIDMAGRWRAAAAAKALSVSRIQVRESPVDRALKGRVSHSLDGSPARSPKSAPVVMKSPVSGSFPFSCFWHCPLVDSVAADEGLDRFARLLPGGGGEGRCRPHGKNYAKELKPRHRKPAHAAPISRGAVAAHKAPRDCSPPTPGENEEGGKPRSPMRSSIGCGPGMKRPPAVLSSPCARPYLRELNKILQARTQASRSPGRARREKTRSNRSKRRPRQKRGRSHRNVLCGSHLGSPQSGEPRFTFAEDGGCLRENRANAVKARGSDVGDVVISSIEGSPQETRYFSLCFEDGRLLRKTPRDKIEMPRAAQVRAAGAKSQMKG